MNKQILKTLSLILLISGISSCKKEEDTKVNDLVIDLVKDYKANGDGITSDRAIIQKAIDDAYINGGGKVYFSDNHSFLMGNVLLRSNVELVFGKNTIIKQNSDVNDYIEVRGFDYGNGFVKIGDPYIPYNGDIVLPTTGFYGTIWPSITDYREVFHYNYPMFYADKGTENIKISGLENSLIEMAEHYDTCENNIHIVTFGFYGVNNFEVNNITCNFTGGHFFDTLCCTNGVIKNVTQHTMRSKGYDLCKWNDGLHIDRCQNILVDSCVFESGDDAFKLGNSYGDVRRDRWASSTDTMIMENIEISNCVCPSTCAGFCFMSTCGTCPDLEKVQMRNIYIHDNKFAGVKVWAQNNLWTPDRSMWNSIQMPISNLTWLRNDAYYAPSGFVQDISGYAPINWISDCISDTSEMKSRETLINGDFNDGSSYWVLDNTSSIATVQRYNDKSYGYIGELDKGISRIYQGLFLTKGSYQLTCKLKSSKDANVYLFVSDQNNNIIKKVKVGSEIWDNYVFDFDITSDSNYRIGICNEISAKGSWAMIDNINLDVVK